MHLIVQFKLLWLVNKKVSKYDWLIKQLADKTMRLACGIQAIQRQALTGLVRKSLRIKAQLACALTKKDLPLKI